MRAAVLVVLVFQLAFLWWGWPESWHPDEIAPREAVRMLEEGDFVPQEPGNPTFQAYLLILLGVVPAKLLGAIVPSAPSAVVICTAAGRLLSAAAAVGVAAVAGWFVASRRGKAAGIVTTLAVGLNSLVLSQGHCATVDMLGAALVFFALLLAGSAPDGARPTRRSFLAGAVAGLAVATKSMLWGPALVVVGCAGFAAGTGARRRSAAAVTGALVGGFLGMPLALLRPYDTAAAFVVSHLHVALLGSQAGVPGAAGRLSAVVLSSGPVVLAAVLLGLLRRRERTERVLILGGVVGAATALLSPTFAPRYLLPAVAPLVAAGMPRIGRRGWAILLGGTAIVQGTLAILQYPTDPRYRAADWIRRHTTPGELVAASPYGPAISGRPTLRIRMSHPGRVAYPAMEEHPILRGLREIGEPLGGDGAESARRIIAGLLEDGGGVMLEGLRSASPDAVAVSSFAWGRYEAPRVAAAYPGEAQTYLRIRSEDAGYRRVARFDPLLPAWVRPPVEFVGPTIEIYVPEE